MRKLWYLILFVSGGILIAECDGFNWYDEIRIEDCHQNDVEVLRAFIENSENTIELDMDVNFNSEIEPLELGWQLWENGRLTHWICSDVPSPWYVYNYSCQLSGLIPENFSNLDKLIKLHLNDNTLKGKIPPYICSMPISRKTDYWFKVDRNKFCPPYPDCISAENEIQDISECGE